MVPLRAYRQARCPVTGYDENFMQALVDKGLLNREQVDGFLGEFGGESGSLCEALSSVCGIPEEQMASFLADYLNVPLVKVNPEAVSPELANLIRSEDAWEYGLLPVGLEDETLTLAISAPLSLEVAEDIAFKTGYETNLVVLPSSQMRAALTAVYGAGSYDLFTEEAEQELIEFVQGDVSEPAEDIVVEEENIIKLVNGLMSQAIKVGASDIHIEPKMDHANVRLRIDGILREYKILPGELHHPVVSRIKILSNLDIAEKRRPQDGVIFIRYAGKRDVDFRVATSPTIYGEGVVLRVLDQGQAHVGLSELGFNNEDFEKTEKALHEPYGFVLSTGPTGSGKTTTMYAMLNRLNSPERKIITIEDPVEYRMDNLNQLPVNKVIQMGFAPLLRSVLRQDPNIILVGEIRDPETAHVAVQAALTGHLLLSTLHTTDAPEVLLRLMEIGVEHFYVREVVKVIVAQRLVRKLCALCKEEYKPTESELAELGVPGSSDVTLMKPVGCNECHNTGYRRRTGVFEVMPMSHEIKDMMVPDVRLTKIRSQAMKEGMRTLWQNASDKVLSGETSLEEIKRAVPR